MHLHPPVPKTPYLGVRGTGSSSDLYRDLLAERDGLNAEFVTADLPGPDWIEGDVPELLLTQPSPSPWDGNREDEQRAWLSRAANQMVNSLRPRLQAATSELAA